MWMSPESVTFWFHCPLPYRAAVFGAMSTSSRMEFESSIAPTIHCDLEMGLVNTTIGILPALGK